MGLITRGLQNKLNDLLSLPVSIKNICRSHILVYNGELYVGGDLDEQNDLR